MVAVTTRASVHQQNIAATRTLRLATGIALALAFANTAGWSGAFVAPILASILLCSPMPAPTLKSAVGFALVFGGSLLLGLALLPMLHNQPAAGVLFIVLALFSCFHFGARGGPAALTTFLLVGITVIPAIGSESIDAAIGMTGGLISGSLAAFFFVWLAHCLFPEPKRESDGTPQSPTAPEPPAPAVALHSAMRSTVIVVPIFLWLLFSSETAGFAVVLIKVATMGQQTGLENTRAAGRDLLQSTLVGGVAAMIVWNVLQIWPTTLIFSLLFLLCGLVIGPKVFAGEGLAPRAAMWSYGLLTMMVIVMPGAMDSAGGDGAGARFSDRMLMFVLATLYAVAAVYVFDRFWPEKSMGNVSTVGAN